MAVQHVLTAVLCVVFAGTASAQNCNCGWFVDPMWAQLSNLDPLDYLPGSNVAVACNLGACQDHCATQGNIAQGVDLNAMVGGKSRGQTYCERIYALLGTDVYNEPLIVLSRVPNCDQFFVWGTTKVFTSTTTRLCCTFGGNYVVC